MPDAPPPSPVPAFTPVSRLRERHDGWTPERQHGFIEALAELGSVKAAAMRVGMTAESAYQLRRHPEAKSFRKAWEAALAHGVTRLEDIALERAIHGVEVPVYSYGKLVGSRTIHNDRLLMFILRNRAPTRFTADGRVAARRGSISDPGEANRLSRLKKQWRKEWEAERAAEAAKNAKSSDQIIENINRKIERMRQNRLAAMSPETRALQDAYEAALKADEERKQAREAAGHAPRLPAPEDAAPSGPSIKPL